MKEEVIIKPIRISRKNEQQFFQVKLPRDTHRIIGIETGMFAESLLPNFPAYSRTDGNVIRPNRLMGKLQLRASGKPNLFYAKEIFEKDINLGNNEIKIILPPVKGKTKGIKVEPGKDGNNFLDFPIWSHGTKREEDPLSICGCNIINGQYNDVVGEFNGIDIRYRIMLYIWIERKVKNES